MSFSITEKGKFCNKQANTNLVINNPVYNVNNAEDKQVIEQPLYYIYRQKRQTAIVKTIARKDKSGNFRFWINVTQLINILPEKIIYELRKLGINLNNKTIPFYRVKIVLDSLLLGRKVFLKPDTDVHHKNGNSLDNRYKNLEAIPHNEHAKKHYEENREHYQNNSFEDAREWGLPDDDDVDVSSTKEAKKVDDSKNNLVGKENFREGSKPICVKDKAKLTIGDLVRFIPNTLPGIQSVVEKMTGKILAFDMFRSRAIVKDDKDRCYFALIDNIEKV